MTNNHVTTFLIDLFVGGRTVLIAFILPFSLWLLASATATGARARTVLVAEVDGIITPVIADHLREGVARAEEESHQAFLVELDTPGGLDASMRDIIETFLGSEVPVVVHVAPPALGRPLRGP